MLDEPVAMLDPVARHDFMATVLTAAADDGVSVLLSSHVLAELERVADYLILLSRGRVQVAGEVDDLLASHRVLTGPAAEADSYAERPVVHVRRAQAQAHLLVRASAEDPLPPGWRGIRSASRKSPLPTCANLAPRRTPARRAGGTRNGRRWRNDGADLCRARPEKDTSLRPLPWRRMAWVTWRQQRVALKWSGRVAGRGGGVCVDQRPSAASRLRRRDRLPPGNVYLPAAEQIRSFDGMDSFLSTGIGSVLAHGIVLQALPAVIGAFVGAPLLARELERRHLPLRVDAGVRTVALDACQVVLLAAALTAAAGAISVLFSWYYQPYFVAGNQARSLPRPPRSIPGCSTCEGSRSPPGHWPRSRSGAWSARSPGGSSPRSP